MEYDYEEIYPSIKATEKSNITIAIGVEYKTPNYRSYIILQFH